MAGVLFPFKRWWLWKGESCCVALVAVKKADCVVWQVEYQPSNVTASIQSNQQDIWQCRIRIAITKYINTYLMITFCHKLTKQFLPWTIFFISQSQ